MRRAVGLFLIVMTCTGVAIAEELIPIGDVLADPDDYHFRLITVEGTVQDVKQLPPYVVQGNTTCYGAYTFQLSDGTDVLEVDVLGFCGKPLLRKPEVTEGEKIILRAQILSPNRETPEAKAKRESSDKAPPLTVRAVANEIRHRQRESQPAESESSPPQVLEEPAKPGEQSGY